MDEIYKVGTHWLKLVGTINLPVRLANEKVFLIFQNLILHFRTPLDDQSHSEFQNIVKVS